MVSEARVAHSGLIFTTGEKSSDSERLCRLFLFPLGIPADLHLCQLDVPDDIGVWETNTGKDLPPVRQEMEHQCARKSTINTELCDIKFW